jgi:hypothetical protein
LNVFEFGNELVPGIEAKWLVHGVIDKSPYGNQSLFLQAYVTKAVFNIVVAISRPHTAFF